MPPLSIAQKTQFAERRGTDGHVLLWLKAKHRTTGESEPLGFWTGDDHQEFLVDGEVRTYFGAGAVIDAPPIVASVGLAVRRYRLSLPPLLDGVKLAMRQYEPRLAEAEIHSLALDIDSGNPLGAPICMFRGFLNEAPEERGGKGATSRTQFVMVSLARKLTFGLPLKRSSTELKRRDPNDKGREYSDVAGEWVVPWG